MFSFGVAHPGPFFRLLSRFQKGVNKLQFGARKRSTLWPEDKFFKSNIMDALTVLYLFVTLIMSSEYLPIGTKETVVLPHIHGIFPTHFNRNGT